MDWSNERYVRLYVRDTLTWRMWTWQARTVLSLLLRKLDRAGVMDIGEHDVTRAVAALIEIPEDVADVGVKELLRDKTLVHANGRICMPNFVQAQEAKQSDAQRQRESRARRRDQAMGEPVTIRDEVSHGVTGHEGPDSEIGRPKPGPAPSLHSDTEAALLELNRARAVAAERRHRKIGALSGRSLKRMISARLHDGATLEDVRTVIGWWEHEIREFDAKRSDWDPFGHLLGGDAVFREANFSKRLGRGKAPGLRHAGGQRQENTRMGVQERLMEIERKKLEQTRSAQRSGGGVMSVSDLMEDRKK